MKAKVADRKGERGAALLEFTLAATVFIVVIFGTLEFGRLLWVHNALTDATRRAARHAVTRGKSNDPASGVQREIKNVAVYGNPDGTGNPLVDGLTPGKVKVTFSDDYALGAGSVSVEIEQYEFQFVVPILGTRMQMPAYRTALTGESAGLVPNPI